MGDNNGTYTIGISTHGVLGGADHGVYVFQGPDGTVYNSFEGLGALGLELHAYASNVLSANADSAVSITWSGSFEEWGTLANVFQVATTLMNSQTGPYQLPIIDGLRGRHIKSPFLSSALGPLRHPIEQPAAPTAPNRQNQSRPRQGTCRRQQQ
jgi:hypothetical protein